MTIFNLFPFKSLCLHCLELFFFPPEMCTAALVVSISSALLCFWTAHGALMRWSEGHGSHELGFPLIHSMTSLSSQVVCDSQAAASPQALPQRVLIPAFTSEQELAVFVAVWEKADATYLSQIGLRKRLSGRLWVTFSCTGQIDAMMHIWAVEQMQLSFSCCKALFLEDSAECSSGLGAQHTSQELS